MHSSLTNPSGSELLIWTALRATGLFFVTAPEARVFVRQIVPTQTVDFELRVTTTLGAAVLVLIDRMWSARILVEISLPVTVECALCSPHVTAPAGGKRVQRGRHHASLRFRERFRKLREAHR